MIRLVELLRGESSSERVVPPSGFTAVLTLASAAAMAFLAVFVLALALSAGRQAADWESALAGSATVRVSGKAEDVETQTETVEIILSQTPGIGTTRRIPDAEQAALLAPWFGSELPLDGLRLPVLIEVEIDGDGPDAEGLAKRFAAEAPDAIFDDHGRWRQPLLDAASGLRTLAAVLLILIATVTAATIALAASASIAANGQVIDVLRLVGASDSYITRAFVRRFTLRALFGASAGTVLGLIAVALLPGVDAGGTPMTVGLGGLDWLWPIAVPVAATIIAYAATKLAARRRLVEVS